MCIIAVKPAGVGIPTLDRLHECFLNNSDGAGVMYPVAGKVRIFKGFMDWDAFTKVYDRLKLLPESTPIVFHFRIGTHGKTKHPSFTHPFPVTYDIEAMKSVKATTDIGVAHNGIISTIDFRFGGSDTMDFIAGVLYPLFLKFKRLKDPVVELILLNFLGKSNKLAVLRGDGDLQLYGDFVEADDGCFYSNTTYESFDWKKYAGTVVYTTGKYSRSNPSCPKFDSCVNGGYVCDICKNFSEYEDYNKAFGGDPT